MKFKLLCISPVVFALAAAAVFTVGSIAGPCRADEDRPNILFIFSDDHAWQAISAYGSQLNQTPNIDRIAAGGMRFDRCLVTNSICGPSRAVILTGKYSHLNGFRDNGDRFDSSQMTFVRRMHDAGYQTAIVGKWHLQSDPVGFDYWSVLPGQGDYYNPAFLGPDGRSKVEGYVTDIITDKAMDWLNKQRDSQKPFLLMVNHKAPHREWMPGPDHLDSFRDDLPEPKTLFDDYVGRPDVIKNQQMTIANHMRLGWDLKYFSSEPSDDDAENRFLGRLTDAQKQKWKAAYDPQNAWFEKAQLSGKDLTRWQYQRYIKDYLRCIASVDDSVGQLLDELDRRGLAENTVVVYSSDQGFYLGEHGWYDKRWIFEQSLRTPLLVRWPKVVQPGSVCSDIVSNLDFAETFLQMAGLKPDAEMQGASLVPLLRGEHPAEWRKSFYYHYYETTTHHVPAHYGVVTDRHKLVCYYKAPGQSDNPDINEWELMDLNLDPDEMRSYLNDQAHDQVRSQLYAELMRLRERFQDAEAPRELKLQ